MSKMSKISKISKISKTNSFFLLRYIAVTHPIFYSKHKNDKRVIFTIVLVWIASAGVGMPIMLGANTSPERIPELCIFYNSNFIIYSSLWSFYVPCVIMVILYYKIFKAIHDRAKKAIGSRKTYTNTISDSYKSALPNENAEQNKKPQEEQAPSTNSIKPTINNKPTINKDVKIKLPLITETDAVTNTGSGSQNDEEDYDEEDEKEEIPLEVVECHIVKDEQTDQTEYTLNITTKTKKSVVTIQSPIEVEVTIGPNGNTNTDSGYAPSNIEETQFSAQNKDTESATEKHSPVISKSNLIAPNERNKNKNKNGATNKLLSSSSQVSSQEAGHNHNHHQRCNDSVSHSHSHSDSTTASASTGTASHMRQPKKKPRFNLGRKHKSSRKKREKASAKRERKATKTLAIVLGMRFI